MFSNEEVEILKELLIGKKIIIREMKDDSIITSDYCLSRINIVYSGTGRITSDDEVVEVYIG